VTTFTYFVSSVDGDDLDSGADWTNAKATVTGAIAEAVTDGATSGDTVIIKVSHVHVVTANAVITYSGIAGVSYSIISVDRSSGDALLAGATESVGAASAAFGISSADGTNWYIDGLIINGGTNANTNCDINLLTATSVGSMLTLKNCNLALNSITNGTYIVCGPPVGSTNRRVKIRIQDCTFTRVSNIGQIINLSCADVEIINATVSLSGANKPGSFVGMVSSGSSAKIVIRDSNLSGYDNTSGGIFGLTNNNNVDMVLKDCTLAASVPIVQGAWSQGSSSVLLRNVDSGDTIYTFEYRTREGTLTETTSVYATGGAAFNGASIGWEIITASTCTEFTPFELPVLSVWNASTSAQTAMVEVANNSATALDDHEIWLELSYPASASLPHYANGNDRYATPCQGGTGADQASSSNGWTGLGGTNTQQKLTVAFTAAEVGLLEGRVRIAKASQTLFLDPYLKVA
jgi:hypothetical protein